MRRTQLSPAQSFSPGPKRWEVDTLARVLLDAEIKAMRDAYAAGDVTQEALARRFKVSRSYVSRLVTDERRPAVPPPVSGGEMGAAVARFLDGKELQPDQDLHACSLRFLAAKMDAVAASDAVGAAQAAPALARQFAETLREMDGDQVDVLAEVARSLSWLRAGAV
jgi:predicted DNA-binding transcriptional regulator YafY